MNAAPTVRIKRKVKLQGEWTFATIARKGSHYLWDQVLVDGQPQTVTGGSFYLEWIAGRKIQRSISTLDPVLALSAKADLEADLRLLFEENSAGLARPVVEPEAIASPSRDPVPVYGYIYKVTLKTTGRVYIGQTRNMAILRWRYHARTAHAGKGSQFQKADEELKSGTRCGQTSPPRVSAKQGITATGK